MKKISDLNILVVGDIMLDHYIIGSVDRISPEAPIPILNTKSEELFLGGCGNVIRNLCEIGANVECITAIGEDDNGEVVKTLLNNLYVESIVLKYDNYITTTKQRFVSDNFIQLLRVDNEVIIDEVDETKYSIIEKLDFNRYDIIIVSDYNKGLISKPLMDLIKLKSIKGIKKNIKILVDPKPIHSHMYNGVFLITPNDAELHEFRTIHGTPKVKYILNTKGDKGMELLDSREFVLDKIPSEKVPVYNVCGAGDTVISVMAICLSQDIDIKKSCRIANECAQYVVKQPKTSSVSRDVFTRAHDHFI